MHKLEEFKNSQQKLEEISFSLEFLKESTHCAKTYPAKGNYREESKTANI